jgi:hypothetical protein
MTLMDAPQFPAGPHVPEEDYDQSRREAILADIAQAPSLLRKAIEGLSNEQLNTRYKNWTIRQIVHHLPDSHVNSYIRFKWTLTEDTPTIKAYYEDRWAELGDARSGDVGPPVAVLDAIHARWLQLLRTMTPEMFARSFLHPESGQLVSLSSALSYYAWHGKHHVGQIMWLRNQNGWK